ncbi:hypothetical protein [Clostridium sp. KNHs216]|uniref:hypothetical protein n=1 Tax=Clostridium sp. KNHs216 TaxID=1550235 RepID=UPI00114E727D|nr:hypothetical protein [Clostridium sp. KNHs216]TQI66269.1 hypothetical protein LY85_0930 [Clostridium sp. KNHs216]
MDKTLKGTFRSITMSDKSVVISKNSGSIINEIEFSDMANFIFEKGTAFKYGRLTICTLDGHGYNVNHGKAASDKNSIAFNSSDANEFELLYLELRNKVDLKTYEDLKPKTVDTPEINPINSETPKKEKSFWQRAAEEGREHNAAKAAQPKQLSKKERIKENKANGIACCPKCGSTSLSANRRGWKLTTGLLGSSKIIVTCMNCGHHWKP